MPSPPLVSLQDIKATEQFTTPTFKYVHSLARHLEDAVAQISALQAQSEPGFAANIDLRHFAVDVGAVNALEIVPQQEPGGASALISGMPFYVLVANTNTSAAVTLEVRDAGDTVQLTADCKRGDGSALAIGDLVAGGIYDFIYYTDGGSIDEFRCLNAGVSSLTTMAEVRTELMAIQLLMG